MSLRSIQKRMYLGGLASKEFCQDNLTIYGIVPKHIDQDKMKKDLEKKLNNIYEINLQFYEEDFEICTRRNSSKLEIEVIYQEDFNIEKIIFPYDLEKDLLYRVYIVKTPLNDYLVMDFNHIIIDEEGIVNLLNILENSEDLESIGTDVSPLISTKEEDKFWFDNSSKFNTYASIPLQVNKKKSGFKVIKKKLELDDMMVNSLKYFDDQNISGSVVKAFALAVVMKNFSKNNRIVMGSIFNTRTLDEISKVGMFANLVPLFYEFNNYSNIIDELKCFEDRYYDMFSRHMYSISNVIKETDVSREDLIKTVFINQQNHEKKLDIYDIKFIDYHSNFNEFDLVVENCESSINFMFNETLFNKHQIESVIKTYRNLLIDFHKKDFLNLYNFVPIIKQSLFIGEKDIKNNEKDVLEVFNRVPNDKIMLEDSNTYLTKDDILKICSRLNYACKKNGYKRIAIYLERNVNLMALVISCIVLGVEYVLIDKKNPESRKKYIVENSKSELLVYNVLDFEINIEKLDVTELLLLKNDYDFINYEGAFFCYTSGSTGNPKAVILRRNSIKNVINSCNKILGVNEDSRAICIANLSFDMFSAEVLFTALNGGYVYIMSEEEQNDINIFQNVIENKQINFMLTTPSRFNVFIKLERLNIFDKMKLICLGGEDISFDISKVLEILHNTNLYNLYGPTETTFFITYKKLNSTQVSLGNVLDNNSIMLVDENEKIVNLYEEGEIVVSGENVASGYFNHDSNNFSVINNKKVYKTGDYAVVNELGELVYKGRKDNQIKVRGQRLDISELELLLRKNNNIIDHIISVKDSLIDLSVILNDEYTLNDLKDHIIKNLPSYFLPNNIYQVNSFDLTLNGKIKDSLNKKIEFQKSNFSIPDQEKLAKIMGVFNEVLKIENTLHDSNFFNLGGDSLSALELSTKLRAKNIEITTYDVIKLQSPNKMLKKINSNNINKSSYYQKTTTILPIYKFYGKYNKLNLRFNMSFILNFPMNYSKDRIITVLESWLKETTLLNNSFILKEDDIYITNKIKSSFIFEIFNKKLQEEEVCEKLQKSIKLSNNLLLAIGLYWENNQYKLLFVIHHFIIDAIGIRSIQEEIDILCEDKSIIVRDDFISEKLFEMENHNTTDKERQLSNQYFENISKERNVNIPSGDINTQHNIFLPINEIDKIKSKLNISTQCMLLSLIAKSLEGNDGNSVNILIERNGNTKSNSFGWGTELGILNLNCRKNDLSNHIYNTHHDLSLFEIVGYNYLRKYYHKNPKEETFKTQISFNYLVDIYNKDSITKISGFGLGDNFDPVINFGNKMDINVLNHKDNICIQFNFNDSSGSFVEGFICKFNAAFESLLSQYKYNSFNLACYSGIEYDKIKSKNIGYDKLPTTQNQKNIIKSCVLKQKIDPAIIELSYNISANLNVNKFIKTLQEYVSINKYLRYKIDCIDENYYLYDDDSSVQIHYEIVDSKQETVKIIERKKLNIFNDHCLQFFIFKINGAYNFVISANHTLIDGSSLGILIDDIFELYLTDKLSKINTSCMIQYCKVVNRYNLNKSTLFWDQLIEKNKLDSIHLKKITRKNYISKSKFIKINHKLDNCEILKDFASENLITLSSIFHAVYCLAKTITHQTNRMYFYAIDYGRSLSDVDVKNGVGIFINKKLYYSNEQMYLNNLKYYITKFSSLNLHEYESNFVDFEVFGLLKTNELFGYDEFNHFETKVYDNIHVNLVNGTEGFPFDINFRINNNGKITIDYNDNVIDKYYVECLLSNYNMIIDYIIKENNISINELAEIGSIYREHSNFDEEISQVSLELRKVWYEILVSNEENFMRAGGDSLKSVILINKVNEIFHVNISVMAFLENPTITHLNNLIIENSIQIKDVSESYELSYSQNLILSDSVLSGNIKKNVLNFLVQITGNFDDQEIIYKLKQIVNANDGLHVQFYVNDGVVIQRFVDVDHEAYKYNITNVNGLEIDYHKEIDEFTQMSNLMEHPMYKFVVNNTNEKLQILFIVSHLICDGESIGIIKKDLEMLFSGQLLNSKNSYKKYLSERMKISQSVETSQYWTKTFNDVTYVNEYDVWSTNTSKIIVHELDNKLLEIIKTINLNYNTLFLSGFSRILKKLNIEGFNIIMDGRILSNSHNTFGMLINTVPFDTSNFSITYENVRKKLFEISTKQFYNFENLNKENYTCLYVYQPVYINDNKSSNVKFIDNIHYTKVEAKVPMSFEVFNDNKLRIVYIKEVFNDSFMSEIIKGFEREVLDIVKGGMS